MKSKPHSDEEPGIPIGTRGEYEMRGLLFPKHLIDKGPGNPSDVIMMPASTAARLVINMLMYWGIPPIDWGAILGVTSERAEDYKNGRFPTEAAELLRLEDLLVIYKSLAIMIPDYSLAQHWCTTPNGYFKHRRPIDVIKAEGTQVVRQYLEGVLG